MTTSPVKSLIEELVDELVLEHLSPSRMPLNEALGLPRDTLVINCPIRSAVTIKNGRRVVRVAQ
ncbi:hypothetical protein [Pseudomonas fluorescens group sp. PF-69]